MGRGVLGVHAQLRVEAEHKHAPAQIQHPLMEGHLAALQILKLVVVILKHVPSMGRGVLGVHAQQHLVALQVLKHVLAQTPHLPMEGPNA